MSTTTASTFTKTTTSPYPIKAITTQMTYYGPIILLVIGIIGCLCNFITFTAPQLRKNSCAFYFLMAAVFDLLSITFGLISRFAADHLGSTLINTDHVYLATYFVLLSSIDRCMSSSIHARLRSFSQIKMAYRASGVAIAIGFLSCMHILIGYDLRPRCGPIPDAFAMYDGMFVVFWLGVIPHILMLVFGFLTFMNIRRTKRRIVSQPQTHPTASSQQQQRKQRADTQLIVMMLFQVGFSSLLILTRMIYYAYYVLAPPLTGYNKLIGSFLMSFTTLVYYANYTKSFYIYTLSSPLFRSIFIERVKFCIQKILGRHTPMILLDNTPNGAQLAIGP